MPFHKKLCLSLLDKRDVQYILLISDIGENLEKFATELLIEADKCETVVELSTIDKLPIQGKSSNEILFVSLIVVLIDITNKESLTSAKASLNHIPIDFFMGRLMFVGLNITDELQWCIEPEEVALLASKYSSPVLWTDISGTSSRSTTCSQILRKLDLLSCKYRHLSSLSTNPALL